MREISVSWGKYIVTNTMMPYFHFTNQFFVISHAKKNMPCYPAVPACSELTKLRFHIVSDEVTGCLNDGLTK